jgi:hypothetical protein
MPDTPDPEPDPEPTGLKLADKYEVVTTLDLSGVNLGMDTQYLDYLNDMAADPLAALTEILTEQVGYDLLSSPISYLLEEVVTDDVKRKISELATNLQEVVPEEITIVSEMGQFYDAALKETITKQSLLTASVVVGGEEYSFELPGGYIAMPSSISGDSLVFAEFTADVPVGEILTGLLDSYVAKELDASASSLADAIAGMVDCESFGPGWLSSITDAFVNACEAGMATVSDDLTSQIDFDGLELNATFEGNAKLEDNDGDNVADSFAGSWKANINGTDAEVSFEATAL